MGEHMCARSFPELHIDLDLLHAGFVSQTETHVDWLSDLRAGFDDHFPGDRVRPFLQIHVDAWDCPMTENTVPVPNDMRNTRIIED
jgi:hypothetical protein